MEPADEITGYQQIDSIAKEALPRLSQRDQSTVRKKLRTYAELYRKRDRQIGDHRSLLHPLGELRMGAILVDLGHCIEYEKKYKVWIDGKHEDRTPDWTAYRTDGEIGYILDLANFHGDGKFEESLLGGPPATVPSDASVLAKLYESMKDKCLRYRELADQIRVPLVVAVYLHFGATWNIDPDKVHDILRSEDGDLYRRFPEVSGFLTSFRRTRLFVIASLNYTALRFSSTARSTVSWNGRLRPVCATRSCGLDRA